MGNNRWDDITQGHRTCSIPSIGSDGWVVGMGLMGRPFPCLSSITEAAAALGTFPWLRGWERLAVVPSPWHRSGQSPAGRGAGTEQL